MIATTVGLQLRRWADVPSSYDVLVVGHRHGRVVGDIAGVRGDGGDWADALVAVAAPGEVVTTIAAPASSGARRVVAVDLDDPSITSLRAAAIAAASRARPGEQVVLAISGGGAADTPTPAQAAAQVAEGVVLGRYHHRRAAGARPAEIVVTADHPAEIVVTADPSPHTAAAVADVVVAAEQANWVRALVDTPPNQLRPDRFAEALVEHAERYGIGATVEPADDRWPAVRAVGAASAVAPRVVRLSYRGAGRGSPVVLIGKGITFDTGGLDLKTLAQLTNMKHDMAGGAAVAGAVCAAAERGLPIDVEVIVPIAENCLGGGAMRPGDVIEHLDGTTTEILGPDAEGRLLLADALLAARALAPACIVDAATLTGGGGLGPDYWAMLCSDRRLGRALLAAGEAVEEPGWELPLHAAYDRYLSSDVADRSNVGGAFRYGFETLLASRYLAAFAGDVPWAHLDISSAAARDTRTCDVVHPRGATGAPTRALVAWLAARVTGGAP